jgi:hypothetical protein
MIWAGFGKLYIYHLSIVTLLVVVVPCWCEEWGFGVMGLELRTVDSDSSGLCSVDSGSLW